MTWHSADDMTLQEKMLWACVLRRAVFDYVLYKGSGKHKLRWQRANQFVFGEEIDGGLNFEQICGLFGWEPDFLRRLTRGLTRADIKKLEASKFREIFGDNPNEFLYTTVRWDTVDAPAPFLQPYHYSRSYRELLELRVIRRPQRHVSFVPIGVQWSARIARDASIH